MYAAKCSFPIALWLCYHYQFDDEEKTFTKHIARLATKVQLWAGQLILKKNMARYPDEMDERGLRWILSEKSYNEDYCKTMSEE